MNTFQKRFVFMAAIFSLGFLSTPAHSQTALPDPTIYGAAISEPGNVASNVFDNNPATFYASRDRGDNTYIDFDFLSPTTINGFDLTQRNDIANVVTSNLIFDDNANFSSPIQTVNLSHSIGNLAYNLFTFPDITAQYVRWDVTSHTPFWALASGASEITFYGPTAATPVPAPAPFLLAPALAASVSRIRQVRRRSLGLNGGKKFLG